MGKTDRARVRMRVRCVNDNPCGGRWTRLDADSGEIDENKPHVASMTLMGVRLADGSYDVTFERIDDDVR